MKKLFLLLIFLVGCSTPTTYYSKKTVTTETVKEVNCHAYKRKTVIKQTQITEIFDEVDPYGDSQITFESEPVLKFHD